MVMLAQNQGITLQDRSRMAIKLLQSLTRIEQYKEKERKEQEKLRNNVQAQKEIIVTNPKQVDPTVFKRSRKIIEDAGIIRARSTSPINEN